MSNWLYNIQFLHSFRQFFSSNLYMTFLNIFFSLGFLILT